MYVCMIVSMYDCMYVYICIYMYAYICMYYNMCIYESLSPIEVLQCLRNIYGLCLSS